MASIAAAITTAIPVVKDIVLAIWPTGDNGSKKKKDVVNAPAVAQLAQKSGDALRSTSDGLALIATIMDACFRAEDNIVSMRAILAATRTDPMSAAEKLSITKAWTQAKKNLSSISDNATRKSVEDIEDAFTSTTFLDIIKAEEPSNIDVDLSNWSVDDLKKDIESLFVKLNKVNSLAIRLIGGVAKGLARLAAAQMRAT